MRCQSCQALMPDESQYCSSCGDSLQPDPTKTEEANRHSQNLLAQANLARMRGKWDEAEQRCIDVMRGDPYNVHAHSLLGDIFRDQDRLEEASQWYQMALDLNPESSADRAKLDLVERQMERDAVENGVPASHKDRADSNTQLIAGLTPAMWLRGVAVVSVIFVIVVVGLLISRRGNGNNTSGSTGEITSGDTTVTSMNAANQPTLPHSPLPTASAPSSQGAPLPSASRRVSTSNELGSSVETTVQTALARNSNLSPEVTVGSVIYNPRDMGIIIQLIEQPIGAGMAPDVLHDAALRDGLKAAQAAFAADSSVQHATISVRTAGASGKPESYFEGDIERSVAGATSTSAPIAQINMVFGNTWWGPIGSAAHNGDE